MLAMLLAVLRWLWRLPYRALIFFPPFRGSPRVTFWIVRIAKIFFAFVLGDWLIRRLLGGGIQIGHRGLETLIIVLAAVLALAAVFVAERHHRHRQQRQRDASTGEQRAVDPERERRHVSSVALAWIVGGILIASAATAIPVGPAIVRAVIATALAGGCAARGWRIADQARAPRPTWLLAATAARDEAPPGIGVPAAVAATFVMALFGATLRWPTGGLGVAAALLVATASRRDVGRRWAAEELSWWRTVATEVGAERVREVRAVRPEPVVWPVGIDSTTRQAVRQLAREFDDSGPERLAYKHVDRFGTEVPIETTQAAVAERDARWGATITLTADRVASDAVTAADRLGERLGLTWAVSADASGLRLAIVPTEPPSLPGEVAPDPIPDHLPILPTTPWFVGIDEVGTRIEVNLVEGAHLLIAGATRSGKSVCTYGLLAHVAAMGPSAQLYIGDPGDTTVAPWISHAHMTTSDVDPHGAIELLKAVRDEMDRRKPLMRELRADKISEFGPDLPLVVVVIDEAAGWLRHKTKRLADEFRDHLLAIVSQGAKYGVRLCLILQRPTSLVLDTATRAQLSTRISFRVDDAQTGAMVFPELGANSTDLLGAAPGVGMIKSWGEVSGRWFRGPLHKDPWDLADQFPIRQQTPASPVPAAPPSPPAPNVSSVPAQPDDATVATAPSVPHAPGAPIVVRRPDGSVRRVVAIAPAPDAARYGIAPKYRLVLGRAEAAAEHASGLVGLLIHDYDEIHDPVERAIARVRWAVQRREDAQARVAGPFAMSVGATLAERLTLKGNAPAPSEWTSAMPLVLVDALYRDPDERPTGNILWMRTGSDLEFLESLTSVGLVDSFLDLSEPSSAKRSDEEGAERQTAMEAMA